MKRSKGKSKAKAGIKKARTISRAKVEVVIKKQVLGEAPVEKHFIVADGNRIKSILELARALETMSEEIFRHHVNETRNDFSNWIRDVFEDNTLADELAKAKDKATAELMLMRKLFKDSVERVYKEVKKW